MQRLILDATPINHFARAGRLDVFTELLDGFECLTTTAVRQELLRGPDAEVALGDAAELDWIEIVDCISLAELYVFAQYMTFFGNSERNAGEATVLAWAEVNDVAAWVDDMVACNRGRQRGVDVRRSLAVIIGGVRRSALSEAQAQEVVNDLAASGMYLPEEACTDLFAWGRVNGAW